MRATRCRWKWPLTPPPAVAIRKSGESTPSLELMEEEDGEAECEEEQGLG